MELPDELHEQTPAWTMGVMLGAMRERGWTFDRAWSSAIQRMRVSPDMEAEDAAELISWKFWLNWAKPRFEWAYAGVPGPPPMLPDLEDAPIALADVLADTVADSVREPPPDAVGPLPSVPTAAQVGRLASG